MGRIVMLAATLIFSCSLFAQRTVRMNNLWEKPQVHVLFEHYTLSFKIKDIDRTLALLAEAGDTTLGLSSKLDSAGDFYTELYPGLRTEYRTPLQPLLQTCVVPFLLMAGHAYIVSPKRKKVKEIIVDIQPGERDDSVAYINFYDPNNNRMLFSGSMPVAIYNKDLGID